MNNSLLTHVPYVFLVAQWSREREALLPIIERVLESGKYIGGQEVETLKVTPLDCAKQSIALL